MDTTSDAHPSHSDTPSSDLSPTLSEPKQPLCRSSTGFVIGAEVSGSSAPQPTSQLSSPPETSSAWMSSMTEADRSEMAERLRDKYGIPYPVEPDDNPSD